MPLFSARQLEQLKQVCDNDPAVLVNLPGPWRKIMVFDLELVQARIAIIEQNTTLCVITWMIFGPSLPMLGAWCSETRRWEPTKTKEL